MAKTIIILGGDTVSQDVAENNTTWSYDVNTNVGPIFPDQNITYTLSGADATYFNIDKSGAITLKSAADYEVKSSYDLVVTATHTSGGKDTQELQLEVMNINDNAPEITGSETVAIVIDENGAAVTTVQATDADGNLNPLVYSIVGGTDGDLFTIDPATGALNFKQSPDYENADHSNVYNVTVGVSDGTFSDTQYVTVTVNNINDNAPELADVAAAVNENSAAGTVVAQLTATDADGALNPITYSLVAGGTGDGLFEVAADGTVSVAAGAVLDYETSQSYTMNVLVSDGLHTDTAVITVNLNDVYEGTTDTSDKNVINVITGTKSSETIIGTEGADFIHAKQGADILVGIGGDDKLQGDAGKDIYYFDAAKTEGNDRIVDFSRDDGDKINVANSDASQIHITKFGNDSVITVDGSSTIITVENKTVTLDDFSFNTLALV